MKHCILTILLALLPLMSFAQAADSVRQAQMKAWRPAPTEEPTGSHFAWGAEFGSSIDLSAHDMSSIDFNAYFGVRHRWLMLAGVGAGADIMVSNSCRSYPIFAIFRTDFSNLRKLVFLDLRGGIVLNYLYDNESQTGGYLSASLGFNLARGKNFNSYITAGYTLNTRKDITRGDITTPYPSLSLAVIRLGVSF